MRDFAKDILISTNLSLRRNIKGYDFPTTMTYDESLVIMDMVRNVFGDRLVLLTDLDDETIDKLISEMVLSPDVTSKLAQVGLIFEGDTTLVINDRDHISINISNFDLDLTGAYKKAVEIEKVLDSHFDFAFSSEYGYLTSGARNAGTGLEIWIKLFLFGLIDNPKTYAGFEQAMVYAGLYPQKFVPQGLKSYADDLYLLKNYGNYREKPETYLKKIEKDLETLVKNERRFRRDYRILNNIDDREVEEEIDLIEKSLKTGLVKSLDKMMKSLYRLKKYQLLGFNIKLSEDELNKMIKNLSSHKYKENFDAGRYEYLMKEMGESHGKQ